MKQQTKQQEKIKYDKPSPLPELQGYTIEEFNKICFDAFQHSPMWADELLIRMNKQDEKTSTYSTHHFKADQKEFAIEKYSHCVVGEAHGLVTIFKDQKDTDYRSNQYGEKYKCEECACYSRDIYNNHAVSRTIGIVNLQNLQNFTRHWETNHK